MMRRTRARIARRHAAAATFACLAIVVANEAHAADDLDEGGSAFEQRAGATARSAGVGALLFLAEAATVDLQQGLAIAFGGYDGAQGAAIFESAAEVRILRAVALRGSAVYSPSRGGMRPSIGAKAQLLEASRHGADGAVGLSYRPEGLTEAEGEIEGVISLGRAFGASTFVGNLVYGQDPEGNERDGEVRLAWLRSIGERLLVGVDSRARFDLGSAPAKLAAHNEATFDMNAGPVATVIIGSVALVAQSGASVRRFAGTTASGIFAMAGVGAAF